MLNVPPICKSITLTQPRGLEAPWKVPHVNLWRALKLYSAEVENILEKANLVEVVRWDLQEMGLYEAMLEWVEPTINVSFSATTDEFKHLFELAYKSVFFYLRPRLLYRGSCFHQGPKKRTLSQACDSSKLL